MFRIAPSQTQAELTSLQEKFKHQLKKQMEMIKDDLKVRRGEGQKRRRRKGRREGGKTLNYLNFLLSLFSFSLISLSIGREIIWSH